MTVKPFNMIYYFSGAGNSRYVARQLGEFLHEEVCHIGSPSPTVSPSATDVFVFPVYGWAPPQVILDFLKGPYAENGNRPAKTYFVAVCGDDTGKTGDIFARSLHESVGMGPEGGFSVTMPNTYVCLPGFDVDDEGVERLKLGSVDARLKYIAEEIKAGVKMKKFDCHEGALPGLKTYVLGAFFRRFLMKPEKFRAMDTCVECGRCAKVCPLGNIRMKDRRPEWGNRCAHCLACYHACPKHAVDYAGRTLDKGQFTHFLRP
jgi:ferredoxin